MKRRSLALVAILLLLSTLLCSCSAGGLLGDTPFTLLGDLFGQYTNKATNLLKDHTPLISDSRSHYSLSVDASVSDEVKAQANALVAEIENKTGVCITSDDALADGGARGKIIVTKKAINDKDNYDFPASSYFIGFVGADLVIRAHSDLMLIAALRDFATSLVNGDPCAVGDGFLFVPRTLSHTGETVSLFKDAKPAFVIMRPEDASDRVISAVTTLQETLSFETNSTIRIRTDFSATDPDVIEIIIGQTVREGSVEALEQLEQNSYYIGSNGKSIIINAPSDFLLERAITVFTTTFVTSSKSDASRIERTLSMPATLDYLHTENVFWVSKDGTTNAVLIYPANAIASTVQWVERLAARIKELTGVTVPVRSDAVPAVKGQLEILVGKTSRDESDAVCSQLSNNDWKVTVHNQKLVLGAANEYATQLALYHFRNSLPEFCKSLNSDWNAQNPTENSVTLYFVEGFVFSPNTN